MTRARSTVLIVSSGRTGTQFLARYFDTNYENIVARHEPPPRVRVRLAANAYAAGALGRERLVALLERKRRETIDSLDADLYIESNPFLWGAIDVFDEVFGEPTILHVVRDPREQVRSSLNHGTGSGWKAMANRWLPHWYPTLPGQSGPGDWFARAAGLWVTVNRRLSEIGPSCADYRLVFYESLFDEENTGLRSLCEGLGVPFCGSGSAIDPAQRINRGQRRAYPGWREWSDAQISALHQIAGPLMAQYGYGREPAWQERLQADQAERLQADPADTTE